MEQTEYVSLQLTGVQLSEIRGSQGTEFISLFICGLLNDAYQLLGFMASNDIHE